jgi:hypothetical protein
MTTGLAVIFMTFMAPVNLYIYFTQGKDAMYEFAFNAFGSIMEVVGSIINGLSL